MFHLPPPDVNERWDHIPSAQVTKTFAPLWVKRWRSIYLKLEVWERAQGGKALLGFWEKNAVPELQHCSHPPECLKHSKNGSAESLKCYPKFGGCGAILSYFSSVAAIESKKTAARKKGGKQGATMLERLEDPERCVRCQRVFQLSMGYGNQKILKCTGWNLPSKSTTRCTMIKALPGEFLPCGPTRQENDISQTGSGNRRSAVNESVRSSISPPSTGAGMISLDQLGVSQVQSMQLLQQLLPQPTVPQQTVQLPLATPTPSFGTSSFSTATPGSQSSAIPSPATAPTPTLNLTMECDDGMIHIPDDDLEDEI